MGGMRGFHYFRRKVVLQQRKVLVGKVMQLSIFIRWGVGGRSLQYSTTMAYQLLDVSVEDAVRLLLLVAELGPVLLLLLLLGLVVLVIDRVEYCLGHLQRKGVIQGPVESSVEVRIT